MQQTISHYRGGSIVHERIDNETRQLLKQVQAGYYKILRYDEGINMEKGTVYVLDGTVHRLTRKGLRYIEAIRKKYSLTKWIKEQLETENWKALEGLEINYNSTHDTDLE